MEILATSSIWQLLIEKQPLYKGEGKWELQQSAGLIATPS